MEREMEEFPSQLERTVASSLLLLSDLPPSLSSMWRDSDSDESQKSLWLSNSKSCSSFFLESTMRRSFPEKSMEMSNSKPSSYFAIQEDDGSEKSVGLSNSKLRSCLSIQDNNSEKSMGLRNSESGSYISISDDGSEKSVGLSYSKSSSCWSRMTRDDGSSAETRAHQFKMVTAVAHNHEMKLKVARKRRTQIMRNYSQLKRNSCEKKSTEMSITTIEASSCLSSGSSGGGAVVSSSRMITKPAVNSSAIRTRAEGIMRVLSYGCASEVRIRQLLGDSPDTSKALRMLLKKEEIRRSGIGGRWDPFIYKIA